MGGNNPLSAISTRLSHVVSITRFISAFPVKKTHYKFMFAHIYTANITSSSRCAVIVASRGREFIRPSSAALSCVVIDNLPTFFAVDTDGSSS